jgi:hypothetical protein
MEGIRSIYGYDDTRACLYKQSDSAPRPVSYQEDFLGIFGLTEWDSEHISGVVSQLVSRFGGEGWFHSVIGRSPFFADGDMEASLSGMFNYDQLDVLHALLCRAIQGGSMDNEDVKQLMEKLRL